MGIETKLQEALNAANGKRNVRTLDYVQVMEIVNYAINNGCGWTSAGSVANAYHYKAVTTAVLVVCVGDRARVKIGTIEAHGKRSPMVWFGCTRSTSNEHVAERAAAWLAKPPVDGEQDFSTRELELAVAAAFEPTRA